MSRKSVLQELADKQGTSIKELVVKALNNSNSNQEAAAALGISYRTLWGYMNRYGITREVTYTTTEK